MNLYRITALALPGLFLLSCGNPAPEQAADGQDLIEITKTQFETEGMEFGEPRYLPFHSTVHFTGTISPAAGGKAQVSVPVAGIVQRVSCQPGQLVRKGQVLMELGGNEFIDMQKDLSSAAARLKQASADYERVKKLYTENIGTQREYVQAESAYQSENAIYNSLKIKLGNLGLDIAGIEDGRFYSTYPLLSPIAGYLTRLSATIGQYSAGQECLAEIVDAGQLQLKMSVFEKDIAGIKPQQRVEFNLPGNDSIKHGATLLQVGKAVNEDSRAVDCYAGIDQSSLFQAYSNQFAEGNIITGTDSAYSVPASSLLKTDNQFYLLDLVKVDDETYYFRKVEVRTGRRYKDHVEILNKPDFQRLLVKGVYNIQL